MHTLIKANVSKEMAFKLFETIPKHGKPEAGDTVLYYLHLTNSLWWGVLKWGHCYWHTCECARRGCRGGVSGHSHRKDKDYICPIQWSKLLMVKMSMEEALVYAL